MSTASTLSWSEKEGEDGRRRIDSRRADEGRGGSNRSPCSFLSLSRFSPRVHGILRFLRALRASIHSGSDDVIFFAFKSMSETMFALRVEFEGSLMPIYRT